MASGLVFHSFSMFVVPCPTFHSFLQALIAALQHSKHGWTPLLRMSWGLLSRTYTDIHYIPKFNNIHSLSLKFKLLQTYISWFWPRNIITYPHRWSLNVIVDAMKRATLCKTTSGDILCCRTCSPAKQKPNDQQITSLRVIPAVTLYYYIFVTNSDILCAKIWRGREGEDNSNSDEI